MMAVVFAFPETFGLDRGTERHAFERTFRTLADAHAWQIDEAALLEVAVHGDLAPPDGVWAAFSAVLGTNPSARPERHVVEALFRNAGKSRVGEFFTPFDDLAPTLRELAALKLPQALLSAGWSGIEQRRAALTGFGGPILVGEELGIDVSAPAAFARVSESVRLPAERIWFVGTDPRRHIAAAHAAGLNTVWLNRERRPFPLDRARPDHTIANVRELLNVVREPYTRGLLALRAVLRTALEWRSNHCVGANDLWPVNERPEVD